MLRGPEKYGGGKILSDSEELAGLGISKLKGGGGFIPRWRFRKRSSLCRRPKLYVLSGSRYLRHSQNVKGCRRKQLYNGERAQANGKDG